MNKPIISIIVPVYNVERYLRECIDSILLQSFTEWELILVDDGSPDTSGTICDEYAKNDARIKVIHKPNGGVSSARNIGIDNASGEWVTFVDADDKILTGFLEGLYKPIAEGEDVDFVHGGCCNMKNGEFVSVNQSYDYYVGTEPEIVFEKLRGLTVSKLFSLENIKNWSVSTSLRFDEKMRIAEDMAFTIDYVLNVKRYAFVPEKGYCYRIDNMNSATKKDYKYDYNEEVIAFTHLWNSTCSFIEKHSLDLSQVQLRIQQRADGFLNMLFCLYFSNYSRKQRLEIISKWCKDDKVEVMKSTQYDCLLLRLLSKKEYPLFDFICSAKSLRIKIKKTIKSIINK